MASEKVKPLKITDHFYSLGTPFFPVYLSIGEEAMLIEGGTGGITKLLQDQIKEIGVDPAKIKYVTLTHSHADHIGLLPHIKSIWSHIKIAGTQKAQEAFQNEEVMKQFVGMDKFIAERLKSIGETSELAPEMPDLKLNVDRIFDEGDVMDLGAGIKWRVISIGGHAPCQVALFEEKEKTLVVGDAAGLYFPHVDAFWPEYFVSLEKYVNSLKRLLDFPSNRTALSHFGVIDGDSNAFIKKSLKATEAYHKEMLERTGKGEDLNAIANEKAKWVLSNHNYMSFEITESMCKLLIKRSQKDADKADLFSGI